MAGNNSKNIKMSALNKQYLQGLNWNTAIGKMRTGPGQRQLLAMYHDYDYESNTQEDWSPFALAAMANDADADTLTFSEAMNHPSAEKFWEAAQTEIDTLNEFEVWDEVTRKPWMNVLPGTWAFRIKRFPTGLIRKLKARFCARGDRQIENVDYFDTFAPVVSWNTVRLLLVLSIELGLATKQVDYTAAFVHADIDKPPNYDTMTADQKAKSGVYVDMPRGFSKPGKVLKLRKALYGLKNSPRCFFLHLKDVLEEAGLKQQVDVDPCLFMSNKVVCIVYVDDTLLFAKTMEDISDVLAIISKKIKLEEEDDVAGFLGVHIARDEKKGEILLTQTGLIDRIIEALQ
jgi:hypothetical protein